MDRSCESFSRRGVVLWEKDAPRTWCLDDNKRDEDAAADRCLRFSKISFELSYSCRHFNAEESVGDA